MEAFLDYRRYSKPVSPEEVGIHIGDQPQRTAASGGRWDTGQQLRHEVQIEFPSWVGLTPCGTPPVAAEVPTQRDGNHDQSPTID